MKFIGKKIVNAAASGAATVNQVIKKFWLTMLSVTLIYIGLTVKLDQLGWDVAIPILNCAFIFWGTYRVMRAEVQLTAMLTGGAINGMPDFKIGEVFAAWKKNVSLPNFKLADFFTKGSLPASLAVIRVWAYIVIGVNMYTTLVLILKVENTWWLFGAFSGLISLGTIDFVRPGSTKLFLKIATVMAIVQVGFGLYMTFHHFTKTEVAGTKTKTVSRENLDGKYSKDLEGVTNDLQSTGKTLSVREEQALDWRNQATGGWSMDRVTSTIFGETVTKRATFTSLDEMTISGLRPRRKYRLKLEKENLAQVLDPAKGTNDIYNLNQFISVGDELAGEGQTFCADDDGQVRVSWPLLEKFYLVSPTIIALTFELQRF